MFKKKNFLNIFKEQKIPSIFKSVLNDGLHVASRVDAAHMSGRLGQHIAENYLKFKKQNTNVSFQIPDVDFATCESRCD